MKKKLYILSLLTVSFFISSCAKKETAKNEVTETTKNTSNIELNDKQLSLSEIETGNTKVQELAHMVTGNGFMELPPENMATISLPISGRIVKVFVTIGDKVKKGQTLAEVEHPEFIQLQKEYLESKSNYTASKSEYERISDLANDNISSTKQLQESRNKYETAKANFEASKASLSLIQVNPETIDQKGVQSRFAIKSPIEGSVTSTSLNLGKSVSPGESLFDIINKSHMHVNLQIFENDLPHIALGDRVEFNLISHPDQKFDAEIQYIGEKVDPDNRSVEVIAHILKPQEVFKEGMYVNGTIHTQKRTVATLPETAIINRYNHWFAFIKKGNSFEEVRVHKGAEMNGLVEILNPQDFPNNNSVVTKGAYYIESEIEKTAD